METVHGFVVTTVCRSVEEFVERYHSRTMTTSKLRTLFVGVIEPRALGGECAFAILLADKSVVLAGVCEVLDVYPHSQNPFGRRGMRLAIRRLGMASEEMWDTLAARAKPLDAQVEAAIEAAMAIDAMARDAAKSVISSNDLSAYAIEFDEQTTVPRYHRAAN